MQIKIHSEHGRQTHFNIKAWNTTRFALLDHYSTFQLKHIGVVLVFTRSRLIWRAASLIVDEQNFGGTLKTLVCPQPSTLNATLCSLPESTPELLSSAITMFRQVIINDCTHNGTSSFLQQVVSWLPITTGNVRSLSFHTKAATPLTAYDQILIWKSLLTKNSR